MSGQPDEANFRRAVERHNVVYLRALLEQSANAAALIDQPIFAFNSPALVYLSADDERVLPLIDVLLQFGADPNRRSEWWAGGFHVLHAARGRVAERLLESGALADACGAANLDRLDLLAALIDEDPLRVHERGGDGKTPLHFARSKAVIDFLLERGADVNARDIDHRATPAQWMLDSRRELAHYLVERGAAVDIFLAAALGLTGVVTTLLARDPGLLQLRTGQGEYGEQPPSSYHIYTWTIGQNLSPIQVAAQFEQRAALAAMLALAAPKERFLSACALGERDEARALLSQHPQLMQELTEEEHRQLADAGWAAHAKAVGLMLELGFDPTIFGHFGGTVLHGAAWEGSVECTEAALRYDNVRALLEEPDPNYGGTPLNWCAHGSVNCGNPRADHAGVARLLLEAGAQPDPDDAASPEVRAVIAQFLK